MSYHCPNGHRVALMRAVPCAEPGCDASVVYEPSAHGMALARENVALREQIQRLEAAIDAAASDAFRQGLGPEPMA